MKQKIYILGLITTVIIILGTLFKINHWPGAAIMIISGMVTLVLIFIPLALRNNFRTEGNRQHPGLYIVIWITCFVVFGGMLFKIMHWPGAGVALSLALPFPYVFFLPIYLVVTSRIKDYDINNTVNVLFLLAVISVFSALLALNVSREMIHDSYGLAKRYNKLELALDETTFPDHQTPLMQKIDDILKIANEYQIRILEVGGTTVPAWNNNPDVLYAPDSPNVVPVALKVGINGTDLSLETALRSFMRELAVTPGCEELAKAAPAIFDFNEISAEPGVWTERIFRLQVQTWVLIYLDGLETNLLTIKATGPY
ncbi:MAG TPA: hypothetical protein VMV47_01805 [Bacteroidales bacterium]|nr:hypothetical protein [Bacteroidales bacterium]